jgi:NHL repeat
VAGWPRPKHCRRCRPHAAQPTLPSQPCRAHPARPILPDRPGPTNPARPPGPGLPCPATIEVIAPADHRATVAFPGNRHSVAPGLRGRRGGRPVGRAKLVPLIDVEDVLGLEGYGVLTSAGRNGRKTMIIDTACGSFDWVPGWGATPVELIGNDVAGVAVDSADRVFLLSRSSTPIVVLDRTGTFIASWGGGDFVRPHGIHVAPDDSVWCADDEGQRLIHYSADGERLEIIQKENRASETGYIVGDSRSVRQSADPFCYPTGIASGADRDIWVTDGYGNARLHHFDSHRNLASSFGRPGNGPLEFVIPHGVLRVPTGELLVSDRENERVQVIDPGGTMVNSWNGVHFPNNVATLDHSVYYVAELGNVIQGIPPEMRVVREAPHARVTARDETGKLLSEILPGPGEALDIWFAPHGIAVDSLGDIYVAEVRNAYSRGLDTTGRPSFGKLVRLAA